MEILMPIIPLSGECTEHPFLISFDLSTVRKDLVNLEILQMIISDEFGSKYRTDPAQCILQYSLFVKPQY
jgi:hypothetical protein